MKKPKQTLFEVSLKILLRSSDKVLLTRDPEGYIDLPGGRIDAGEENASFKDIIAREVREELGESIKFTLDTVLFIYRRSVHSDDYLGVVFDAEYISGDIELLDSNEHVSYKWVDRRIYKLKREDFLLAHQEKYEAFKKYFEKENLPAQAGRQ